MTATQPSDLTDTPILLARAVDLFPSPISLASGHNYRKRGVKLPDGTIVKLQCLRIGACYYTMRRWIADFIAAQNQGEQLG